MPEIDSYSNVDPVDQDQFVCGRGVSTYNVLWGNIKTTIEDYLRASDVTVTGGWVFDSGLYADGGHDADQGDIFNVAAVLNVHDGGSKELLGSAKWSSANGRWEYTRDTNGAWRMNLEDDPVRFLVAPSGTEGNEATFTTVFQATSSGELGIATNPSYALHSAGDVAADGTVRDLSDRRVKEAIEPIEDPLWITGSLRGHTYDRTDKDRHSAGLLAQDVEDVFPVAVDESGDLKTLDQGALLGLAFSAINALQQENEELRQRLDKIEEQL